MLVLVITLTAGLLFAAGRLMALRRTLKSVTHQFQAHTPLDSNALIRIPPSGTLINTLTQQLNDSLITLRAQKLRLEKGDREFREALMMWAHDLRTPLTAIAGYMELLAREPQTEAGSRYLSTIRSRIQTIEEITEELFAFALLHADREDLRPETLDLRALTEETAAAFYDAFVHAGIAAQTDLDSVFVTADARAVKRILYNLFSNALKHSSTKVHIILRSNGELLFQAHSAHLDTLAAEALFGRYFSVSRSRGSSGVGLAVVRSLTEKLGGKFRGRVYDGILEISLLLPTAACPTENLP